jgi:hypothetical protein
MGRQPSSLVERRVQVRLLVLFALALVPAGGAKHTCFVDRIGRDDRRDRVVVGEPLLAHRARDVRGQGVTGERARRDHERPGFRQPLDDFAPDLDQRVFP